MIGVKAFVVSLLVATAAAGRLEDALAYLTKRGASKRYNDDLLALATIPSVSSLPEHAPDVQEAADWLLKRLTAAGFEDAKLLPSDQQPAVYAEWLRAAGQPTVLLYGHYDVQPADPLELWAQPPFQPYIENGSFWGRGVSDDKGGLLQPIHAVEAYLKSSGRLPVNVKIVLEGQEEIGSPDMPAFLQQHRRQLAADTVVSADGGQISEDQGGIAIGLRGAAAFEVEATTLSTDVHSGTFGGSVMNANIALSKFLQTLHLPSNAVNISGFYKDVRTPTEEDLEDMKLYAYDEERVREAMGATEAFGEEGYSSLARLWVRPTCEVVGMWGGFTGTGVKTIVPATATAKVVCRLVPDQHPDDVIQAARAKVEAASIPGTRLAFRKLGFAGKPYLMDRDTPTNRAVATVLRQLLPKPPLYVRFGGSIPATGYFEQYLGIETSMFAWGLEGNRVHAPNERYGLKQYEKGREGYVRLLQQLTVPPTVSSFAPGAAQSAATEADAEL